MLEKSKIKASVMDIVLGMVVLLINYAIVRYIIFDYRLCSIHLAITFLSVGLIRGKNRATSLWIKAVFINLLTIAYLVVKGLRSPHNLPFPIVSILCTILGLSISANWASKSIKKSLSLVLVPLLTIILLSTTLYPRYLSYLFTTEVREPAPLFEIYSLEGESIRSNELKGKVILLEYWSST